MSTEISIESEPIAPVEVEEEEETGIAPETLPADNISLVNTFQMRPPLRDAFSPATVKVIINTVLKEKLAGKTYNVTDVAKWVRNISDDVIRKIKDTAAAPRFKHVVQVYIAQQLGSGCQYIARCCWDAESDSFVSDTFTNPSLFCVCTVFGIFQY